MIESCFCMYVVWGIQQHVSVDTRWRPRLSRTSLYREPQHVELLQNDVFVCTLHGEVDSTWLETQVGGQIFPVHAQVLCTGLYEFYLTAILHLLSSTTKIPIQRTLKGDELRRFYMLRCFVQACTGKIWTPSCVSNQVLSTTPCNVHTKTSFCRSSTRWGSLYRLVRLNLHRHLVSTDTYYWIPHTTYIQNQLFNTAT